MRGVGARFRQNADEGQPVGGPKAGQKQSGYQETPLTSALAAAVPGADGHQVERVAHALCSVEREGEVAGEDARDESQLQGRSMSCMARGRAGAAHHQCISVDK